MFSGKHLCPGLLFYKYGYKKRGSYIYRKSNYATFYLKLPQVCCISVSYSRLYKVLSFEKISKSSIQYTCYWDWRLLTCQNGQMICRPYYWDKQHANIRPLILMTDWLMAMRCSQKTTFYFSSVFNGPTSILSIQNHFYGIFLNSHKYLQEIRHLFWDTFETS